MSTATVPTPDARSRQTIGLTRLTRVELRKSVDTRAGRWLLIVIAGLSLLLAGGLLAIQIFADEPSELLGYLGSQQIPIGFLMPVVGILAVTSEWSQRTAMTTYALVPDRNRVTMAKIGAGVALGLIAGLAALAVAAIGGGLTQALGADAGWGDVPWQVWVQLLVFAVSNVLVGVAFGLAFANSAVAIVLFFVIPTAVLIVSGLVGGFLPGLQDVLPWVNLNQSSGPLFFEAIDGTQWAQFGTSLLVWMVLPMTIGWIRTSRREIA